MRQRRKLKSLNQDGKQTMTNFASNFNKLMSEPSNDNLDQEEA